MASPFLIGAVMEASAIGLAAEQGSNFFLLSADLHWPKYEHARRGLADLLRRPGARDDIVVAALSYAWGTGAAAAAFREVVEAVPGLERIDVGIVGAADDATALGRLRELDELRTPGGTGLKGRGAQFVEPGLAGTLAGLCAVDVALASVNAFRPVERKRLSSLLAAYPAASRAPVFAFGAAYGFYEDKLLAGAGLPADKWRPARTDHFRYALTWTVCDGVVLSSVTCDDMNRIVRDSESGLTDEETQYLEDLCDLVEGRARLLGRPVVREENAWVRRDEPLPRERLNRPGTPSDTVNRDVPLRSMGSTGE